MPVGGEKRASVGLLELISQRYEFLAALDATAYEKRTLVDELEVSRSTVDRAIRDLETADLVDHVDGEYRVTLYGRTLLAIYESILDNIEQTVRARALLSRLPPEVEFDFNLLVDAEIALARGLAVHAPESRITELFENSSRVRGLAYSHTSSRALDTVRRRVCDEGMVAELVFREEMIAYLRESYSEEMRTILGTNRFDAYAAPDVPFGLFLFESREADRLCLAVYDGQRNMEGIIVNDNPDSIAWAEEVFERYRTRSVPVSIE